MKQLKRLSLAQAAMTLLAKTAPPLPIGQEWQ